MPTILSPDDGIASNEERFTSMSLTRNADAVIRETRLQRTSRPVNNIDDIERSRPRSLPPFSRAEKHDPADIDGARPRLLHRERRVTADVLAMSAVLPGSTSVAAGFETRTKRRDIDPLVPQYKLPTAAAPPPPEVPFKRDLHDPGDIAGTKSTTYLPWATRDNINVDDIGGTHAFPRTFTRDVDLNTLRVRDINEESKGGNPRFVSHRRVDPQRPEHTIHGRVLYDDDKKMYIKPRTRDAGRPFNPLTTADIEGAQTCFQQEVPVGRIPPEKRKHYRVTNFIQDIEGAHAGSVRRGLTNVRATDPVERDYVLLDGRHYSAEEMAVGRSWYNAAATVLEREAAELSATMPMGKTGLGVTVGAGMTYAKRILDPRDAEIAQLRGQMDTLRKEREIHSLTTALGQTGQGAQALGQTAGMGGMAGANERTRGPMIPGGDSMVFGTTKYRGSQTVLPGPCLPLNPSPAFTASAQLGHASEHLSRAEAATSLSPRQALESAGSAATATSTLRAGSAGGGPSQENTAPPDASSSTSALADVGKTLVEERLAAQRGYREYDPVASLRVSVANATARNIIGVIPTFPSATIGAMQAAMGASGALRKSGHLDRMLESNPGGDGAPAMRGEPKFARPTPSQQVMPSVRTNHQASMQRLAHKEKAAEMAEVRGLPDHNPKKK